MNLIEPLGYVFFQHALIASVFSAIICGFIGAYIVARRMVFISGGITHASFGGMGLAYFFGFNYLLGAAIFALISALTVEYLSKRTEVREDSAIGMLWSLGMAIGIIFTFLTPGYAPNLMSALFGSILAVSNTELWLMAGLAVVIILFFVEFFPAILAVAFDIEYASTHHIPVNFINYSLISLIALAIVLNIRVSGIILVLAMMTIPPVTANLLTKRLKPMILLSIALGLAGNVLGLILSYLLNLPSGATIIVTHILIFGIIKLCKSVSKLTVHERIL
jgi:zinc transport system permease protein